MSQHFFTYDVIVVGGGAAGVAAAVGARSAGARTLLIERNPYFGGQATHSSLPSYCGFYTQANPPVQIVGGVGQAVLHKLAARGFFNGPKRTARTGTSIVPLDPEAIKLVLDECLQDAGVDVLLHTQVTEAYVCEGTITKIVAVTDEGQQIFSAAAYVDASGEANLTAQAGGGCVLGDGQGRLQSATLMYRIGGVPPAADAHPVKVAEAVRQAKAAGVQHLTKELGTVIRLPAPSNDIMAILADESADGTDSWSMTKCEISGRRQAWAYLEAFRRFLPGFEQAYLVQTGPKIGIRETRHIIGEATVTKDCVLEAKKQPSAIACGGWPVEMHPEPGAENVWQSIKEHSYYHIPLGALKPVDLKNVWAGGRIISCDQVAFSSLRVMGTGFATGQAAGVAAALQALHGCPEVESVQQELLRQGSILNLSEVMI